MRILFTPVFSVYICWALMISGIYVNAAQDFDLQEYIYQEATLGKKHIDIPTGVYYLEPGEVAHLTLGGIKDTTVDFNGSEIVCQENTRAIHIQGCSNLNILNLFIDYEPKLYTQGVILNITPKTIDLEIQAGYPLDDISPKDADVYDSVSMELKPGFRTFHDFSQIEKIGSRALRVHRKRALPMDRFMQVGDIMVLKRKEQRRDGGTFYPHAVYSFRSRSVRFENVTVYASNCFSFLDEECSAAEYYRCKVERKKNDPLVKFPRLRSSNWDAFHSINAEVGPTIMECQAHHMGDDAVNIRGTYHVLFPKSKNESIVLAKNACNIRVGDPVEVLNLTGKRIAESKVVAMSKLPAIPDGLREEALEKLDLIIPSVLHTAWFIELEDEVPLAEMSVICATNRTGRGFKVIGNTFGNNRSRGILCKASNGIIAHNVVHDTGLESLKLTPNILNWLEGSFFDHVVVEHNTFRNGKFSHHWGSEDPVPLLIGGCRTGLRFENNRVEYHTPVALKLSDTSRPVLEQNQWEFTGNTKRHTPVIYENVESDN